MTSEIVLIGFYVVIFLYTVIAHEVMHGVAALWLGDKTAKYAGRINLNPLSHLDLWGSILMPLLMLFAFGFPFGWAKPVPYNPYNLRNQKWGPTLVAFAGPLVNIFLALVAAGIAKLLSVPMPLKQAIVANFNKWEEVSYLISNSLPAITFELLVMVIFWNVLLAFFNLIPLPPLDGSKLLFALFDFKTKTIIFLENFGFVFLLLVILFFSAPLGAFLDLMLRSFLSLAL